MHRLAAWLLPNPGRRMAGDRWEQLPQPVPGYSGIDGLPVAVVAVRRNGPAGLLEVIRGYHPSSEWPGASAPPNAQRHQIPAASFIPHPRRELIIEEQRFFYSTVASTIACAVCGRDDLGFGFVGSEVPLAGMDSANDDHRVLCESCAERAIRG